MTTSAEALAEYNARLDAGDFAGAAAAYERYEELQDAEPEELPEEVAPLARDDVREIVGLPPLAEVEPEPVAFTIEHERGTTVTNVEPKPGECARVSPLEAALAMLPEGSPVRAFSEANAARPVTPPGGGPVGSAKEYAKGQKIAFHTSPGFVGWPDNLRQVEAGTVGVIEACSDTNPTGYSVTIDYGDNNRYHFWTSSKLFGPFGPAK